MRARTSGWVATRPLAAEHEVRVIREIFQAASVVGVQMTERNSLNANEIQRNTRGLRALVQQFADRVGAVDQEPIISRAEGHAGRVMKCGEGVADTERDD